MVLPAQKMSEDIARQAANEQLKRMAAEGKTNAQMTAMIMRQWAIEKAVQVCGQDGVVWVGGVQGKWTDYSKPDGVPEVVHATPADPPPQMRSAVVPIAKEIFAFVMGENDDGSVQN